MAASNTFNYAENGFLVINTTASTSTYGKYVLRMNNIEVNIENDMDEYSTLDNPFVKIYEQSYSDWSLSCSGYLTPDTGETQITGISSSGDTKINGTINGLELIDVALDRDNPKSIIVKLHTNVYYKGAVVIKSMKISAQVGQAYEYDLQIQGSSTLTKVTS